MNTASMNTAKVAKLLENWPGRWLTRAQAHDTLTGTFGVSFTYAMAVLNLTDAYGYHTNAARNLAVIKSPGGYAVPDLPGNLDAVDHG
jgi:hypothetical protein